MIQFFVSSTFTDMAGERELLHQKVLPKVNEYARELGEYIECTDLRWGVDTDHMGKILEVCLSQIKDPCNYNMIVFVGGNYGSIPDDQEVVRQQWNKEAGADDLKDYAISVTQLELEYGIFMNHGENAIKIVLLRKENDSYKDAYPQEEESKKKQEILLNRLNEMPDICKITYSAEWNGTKSVRLDKMGEELVNSIRHLVEEHCTARKGLNWIEETATETEAFISQLIHHFQGRERLRNEIKDLIADKSIQTILIYGESASGKSSIMSKVYSEIDSARKYFIACGHVRRSRGYLDVLIQMIYFVEKNLTRNAKKEIKPQEIYSEEKAEAVFLGMVFEYNKTEDKELLIFVDALDQLSASGNIKIHRLLTRTGKVKIICSWMREKTEELPDGVKNVRISGLTNDDVKAIVVGNMVVAAKYATMMADILCDQRQSNNPLYISSALDILQMNLEQVRGMEHREIYEYFCDKIKALPTKLPDLCWSTLNEAGRYLDFPGYRFVCGMIAASENGLRSGDLENLFRKSFKGSETEGNWKFDLFKAYLNRNLYFRIQENGCWTFGHDMIKQGVEQNLKKEMHTYKDILFEYIKQLPVNDEVKIREGLTLSSELGDIHLPEMIFRELLEKYTDEQGTLVVQTMYNIVFEKERAGWYYQIIDSYADILIKVLEKGLHYKGGVQYNRRYPTKWLMDLYWNVLRSRQLCLEIKEFSEKKQKEYCALCAQYVGIYDDISRHVEAFMYELPVYEYMKQTKFDSLSEQDKALLYENANLIFFSNNKIIANIRRGKLKPYQIYEDSRKISDDIVNWYKENIKKPDAQFEKRGRTEGKFVNNIGQYYEAIGDYNTAYGYRAEALQIKARPIFSRISKCGDLCKQEFETIMKEKHFLVPAHSRFWEKMLEEKQITDEEWKAIEGNWKQIAVSYRTIATDCFYLANTADTDARRGWIQEAIGFHELCIDMLKQGKVKDMEKEIAVTYIRKLGAFGKMCSFFPETMEENQKEIVSCAEEATSWTLNFALQDNQEQENLKDNLSKMIKIFQEKKMDTISLQQCHDRVLVMEKDI